MMHKWNGSRPEHFSGRAGFGPGSKNFCYFGPKKPAHDHPTGRVGPQFSRRARAGPRLGRVARAFYSVKQLKNSISGRARAKKKKIRGLQDLCPRPSNKVRGRAWRGPGPGPANGPSRAGLKMLRYKREVGNADGTCSFLQSIQYDTSTNIIKKYCLP
jgi:hypothetical protein